WCHPSVDAFRAPEALLPARPRRLRFRPPRDLAGLAIASLALAAGCGSPPDPRPNVLLITLDTTRADRLGCYGHERDTSPNLDALAGDGIRCDLAIATAALTPVAHASILTGLLPQNHGVRVIYAASGYRLPDAVPTLTTVLGEAGWRTGAFLSAFPVSDFYGFDRGFDTFDSGLGHTSEDVLEETREGHWGFDIEANQRRSDDTTDAALEWIGGSRDPFFAWIHYWDPHDPLLVPPRDVADRYQPEIALSRPVQQRALYDAEIHWMDRQIGRVLDALRERGEYDDTIIVVVSDHGEGLGDHDHWYHRILYQEQIRVPLILRLPGAETGRVVKELVRTTDIFPTVLEALELDPSGQIDGWPLQDLLAGRDPGPRHGYADALILYDLNAQDLLEKRPQDDVLHCYMDARWKLIHRPLRPEESELYDLREDPRELRNVYAEEPERAGELLARLEATDPLVDGPFGEGGDAEAIERLRALGYVD
ncbi:MAG TPA: sulfatase, partial [bacterium]|nr:sulfatase [bacterium]